MAKGHEGKVAVVTGGAEGLGQAFAIRLAEDGVDVVVADLKPAEETLHEVAATGRRGFAVKCNVGDPSDVTELAREAEGRLGRCDILVNAAGIYPHQPFDDITFDDWRRVLSVNLDSMFLLTKAFSTGMRQRGWGRIVNIASDTVSLTIPEFVHYITSKSGVIGFTRAIATEFAQHGVTANVIAPGLTLTPGTRAREEWGGVAPEVFFKNTAEHIPMKRLGAPDDLVGVMSFLTSYDAAYITGQTIYVNGGLTRT
jgi:NAD(P)-dependent dehydrogenase (short-subunit alcohol dehydrogenase family)